MRRLLDRLLSRFAAPSDRSAESHAHAVYFEQNPMPMWVFDSETYAFLDVNVAAIAHYGYTRDEFLAMTIKDIRPPEDVPWLIEIASRAEPKRAGIARHRKKSGELVHVEIVSHEIRHRGRRARLVLANDVTERHRAEAALRDSEARLRAMFEQAGVAMVVGDCDGRFLLVNDLVVQLLGYPRDQLVGRDFRELTSAADLPRELELLERLRAGELQRYSLEKRMLRSDGAELWSLVHVSFLRDHQGTPGSILAVIEDISERKRAEQALRESEEQLRTVTDGVPALIGYMDTGGRFLFVNRACEVILGRRREEVLGRGVAELVGEAGYAAIAGPFQRAVGGERREVAVQMDVPERGRRALHVTYIPRLGADGAVVGVVSLVQDVTEQRRLEEQVRQSQKLEAVGQLAGGVAHDFNNLLTVITATVAIALEDPGLSTELRADLLEVRRAAARATDLTRQLLALGRKQTVQLRVLDVNATVADAEKMLRRLVREDVALETRLPPEPAYALVDPVQLEIALMNLVVNSRDAMPRGGRIRISTADVEVEPELARGVPGLEPGRHVAIEVADDGRGMPPDVLARACEPFFTTKPIGQGTGLGLATVYAIARQSGGSLRLRSAVGAGTTATLYLPRLAEDDLDPAASGSSAKPARGTETVLVVEDESAVRAMATRVLRDLGYTVVAAASGTEALALLGERQGAVDLVVTDVIMPQMGGPELAARVAREWPRIRVLFTTGYAAEEFGERRLPGRAPLLQKPFTPDALGAAVRAALDDRAERGSR